MTTWIAILIAVLAPATGPMAEEPRSHVGLVAVFAGDSCGEAWSRHPVRFDFVRATTGTTVRELRFLADGKRPLELAHGRYDVRVYLRYKGGYSYYDTESIEVTQDGWAAGFGCRRGSDKPSLWLE